MDSGSVLTSTACQYSLCSPIVISETYCQKLFTLACSSTRTVWKWNRLTLASDPYITPLHPRMIDSTLRLGFCTVDLGGIDMENPSFQGRCSIPPVPFLHVSHHLSLS
jgi:hypothetical protein